MDSRKKIFKLKCFYPLKILTFPFYLQSLGAFLFPSSFLNTFSLSLSLSLSLFSMLCLFEDLGILMINEEKNTLRKFLFK
jgi:hypothetical protein